MCGVCRHQQHAGLAVDGSARGAPPIDVGRRICGRKAVADDGPAVDRCQRRRKDGLLPVLRAPARTGRGEVPTVPRRGSVAGVPRRPEPGGDGRQLRGRRDRGAGPGAGPAATRLGSPGGTRHPRISLPWPVPTSPSWRPSGPRPLAGSYPADPAVLGVTLCAVAGFVSHRRNQLRRGKGGAVRSIGGGMPPPIDQTIGRGPWPGGRGPGADGERGG